MVNPDFKITTNEPGKKSYDTRIGEDGPVGTPQTKKEFKALLRKDPDKEEEEQNKGKWVVVEPEVNTDERVVTKKAKPEAPKTKASIFTLSEDSAKKTKEPEVQTTEVKEPIQPEALPILPDSKTEKELPTMAMPNLYVPKEEKKSSPVLSDVSPKSKMKMKPETAEGEEKPLIAPITSEREDTTEFSEEEAGEELLAIKANQTPLKHVEPLVAYREPDAVPITNLAKAAPVVERPDVAREDLPSIFSPAFVPKKEEPRTPLKFSQEQPDLAYVNPNYINVQVATPTLQNVEVPRAPQMPTDLQRLFSQMVEKMTTLTHEGKTDTTITIKHPPLFEGATLKLTSFESAPKEFNITFENLKPEALLILQQNNDELKQALENKGFVIHIITTRTETETPIYTGESRTGKEQKEEQRREESRQEQRERNR